MIVNKMALATKSMYHLGKHYTAALKHSAIYTSLQCNIFQKTHPECKVLVILYTAY